LIEFGYVIIGWFKFPNYLKRFNLVLFVKLELTPYPYGHESSRRIF